MRILLDISNRVYLYMQCICVEAAQYDGTSAYICPAEWAEQGVCEGLVRSKNDQYSVIWEWKPTFQLTTISSNKVVTQQLQNVKSKT